MRIKEERDDRRRGSHDGDKITSKFSEQCGFHGSEPGTWSSGRRT